MKIFVLSMDTEIGQKRRDLLNYEYEWVHSVDCPEKYKSKFKLMYNISDKKRNAIYNCFAGHLNIMDIIIKRKIDNCVICEDDAFIIWDKEGVDTSNINEICLFSGRFHHPRSWKEDSKWRKEVLPTISLENGINKIDYDTYRWGGTAAIYYPTWQKVLELYNEIMELDKWKHFDLFLSENHLINHYYYPSPFAAIDCINDKKELDKITSQVAEGQGIVVNYQSSKDPEIFEKLKPLIF